LLIDLDGFKEVSDSFDSLTPKEKSVLTLLAQGLQLKEVGSHLSISVKAAETHRDNSAASWAIQIALRSSASHSTAASSKRRSSRSKPNDI
jgi:FixJ family two-component response regulator